MTFKLEQVASIIDHKHINDLPDLIEINTIEELLELMDTYQYNLVIQYFSNTIIIGNGYLDDL